MNPKKFFLSAAAAAALVVTSPLLSDCVPAEPAALSRERAAKILKVVDDLWRGVSSHGIISMKIQTRHYTRNMRLEAWSKGKALTFVRIIAPLKEKGTATLKSGGDVYTYLPKTDRTIKITSGMMMSSWMGSHFTNDDLVKESRLSDDYDAEVSFEGSKKGTGVIELTLRPKEESAVVWGAIKITVRRKDYIPVVGVYYDEDLNPVRTMEFAVIRKMGGRLIPTLLRLTPRDKPEEFTELIYEKMAFDISIPDSFFTISRIRRK